MSMQIEEKNFEEIHIIKPLWEELNKHHQDVSVYFKSKYMHFTFEKRMEALKSKAATGIVRLLLLSDVDSGIIAGYCILSAEKEKGAIESIYIEKKYRKKGYGGKMIEKAFQWFNQQNIADITIDVVYDNMEAIPFYNRYGFYPAAYILKHKN